MGNFTFYSRPLYILGAFLLLSIFLFSGFVSADSQGANDGTTFVSDSSVGTRSWLSSSNAQTSNNDRAVTQSLSLGDGQISHYLKATGFNFTIPDGASIEGIQVDVERMQNDAGELKISDNAVRIVKGGLIGSTDKSSDILWPDSDTYITYGAKDDLWGETWTSADINSEDFGFAISAKKDDTGGSRRAKIDHIRITVYYTPDTIAPVITLLGNNPQSVGLNSAYTDAGATASDNFAGDLTSSITTLNPVNTSMIGTYTVTYDVTDPAGNPAIQVTRTVLVNSFSNEESNVSLSFTELPSGTFMFDVQESSSTNTSTSGFIVGGKFFEITSDLLDGTFNVTLTFSYEDANNDGIVDGTDINEVLLDVYFFNEETSSWVLIPAVKDFDENTLTVTVDHFTVFGFLTTIPLGGGSGGGGGGGRSSSINTITLLSTTTTPAAPTPEETPETTEQTPEAPTPGFFAGITGAVIGALGTGGAIFVLIFVVLVVAGAILAARQSRLESKAKAKKE